MAVEEPVDVILSPAFYWFREEVLPARNASQAKKLAPSFFDTLLPEGMYEYMAVSRNEKFWLFAYDSAEIAEHLSDIGLKPSRIRAVYFAQTECYATETPLKVDDATSLAVVDDVVTLVAAKYAPAEETVQAYCARTARSRHKAGVSLYRSGLLDERQVGKLIAIAVAFLAVYFGNYMLLRHQYKQERIRAYALRQRYHLPETSFQLKSLVRSLESKEARQLRFRHRFKQLTQLPLEAGEAVTKMSFEGRKADLVITLAVPKHAEAIKNALQKNGRVTSAKVKGKIFHVSVVYE